MTSQTPLLDLVFDSLIMSKLLYASPSWSGYLNAECVSTIQKLLSKSVKWAVTTVVNVTRLLIYLLFVMRNCFLVCVSDLIIACIICCCLVNVTLDTILGIEDILMSWFLIILALLDVALLSVCCLIHCNHLRLSDVNKHTYLLT